MTASRRRALAASLATIAVLTMALAACSPPTEPEPTTAPTVAPSPTPTPTPAGPHAAFDGDCGAVLSDDALSEAMGQRMNPWEANWEDGVDAALGGVTCRWVSEEYLAAFVTVHVYPVEVLDADFVASERANGCMVELSECITSRSFGDVWAAVRVSSNASADDVDGVAPLLADIGSRLTSQPRPVPAAREGWWGPAPTCDELQASLVAGGMTATAMEGHLAPPPEFADGPLLRICTLEATIDGERYSTQVYLRAGAAGAVESALAAGSESRVEFEGHVFAATAEQYMIDGASGVLLGAVGPNLVEIDRRDFDGGAKNDAAVLAAIVTALG